MAKKKPKDFLEPWTATKDQTWASGFRFPPVESEHLDADYVAKWHDAKAKAEESAHWYVWGSRMTQPGVSEDLSGGMHVFTGQGILAFSRNLGLMPGAPSHAEACKRACECVNACRSIADPTKLIDDVRALLLALVQGEVGPDDKRILSCLGRMIPLEQLETIASDTRAAIDQDGND